MDGRRERKKQQTRAALLDAAMALFAERGISGARIEDITERADLGKGAFYNYFSSKDALIAELVSQGVELLERDYLRRLNGDSDLTVRIGQLARLHAAFLDDHPQYALLIHQARGLLQLRNSRVEKLREVFSGYLLRVGRAIAPQTGGASWTDADLVDVAAALVGSVSGYRSFRIAAALPSAGTAESFLTLGIPKLLEQRREKAP